MRYTSVTLAALGALALAGCETIAEEVNEAVSPEFTAILAPMGAGSGSGKAELSLNDATNTICTDLELTQSGTMTAGHLMGPGNRAIIDLDVPDDNDSADCEGVSDGVIDAIRANPGAYFVHIAATTGDLHGVLRRDR